MAIMDKLGEFGTAQDLSQSTGTYLFSNQIDLGAAGRDIGDGKQVFLNIVIVEAVVGTTSTIEFRLRSDDSASIHATTSSGHFTTGAIAEASLTAGTRLSFALPLAGAVPYERYLGLQAIVGTNTTTAGTATAWLGFDPIAAPKAYADATN